MICTFPYRFFYKFTSLQISDSFFYKFLAKAIKEAPELEACVGGPIFFPSFRNNIPLKCLSALLFSLKVIHLFFFMNPITTGCCIFKHKAFTHKRYLKNWQTKIFVSLISEAHWEKKAYLGLWIILPIKYLRNGTETD